MNNLRFNGGTFNGARVVSALALVACTATASVAAEATYVHKCTSSITSSASIAANAHFEFAGNVSALIGNAYFQAVPTLNQRAKWDVVASANLIGYSLRLIPASVEVVASAVFTAIPASSFGTGNVLATASINAVATKSQFANANLLAIAEFPACQSVVTRMVQANLVGSSELRVETSLNNVQEAYGEPTALSTISIQDAGVVIKQVGALITGVADVTAVPAHHQRSYAVIDTLAELSADGYVRCDVQGNVFGSASVSATAEYQYYTDVALLGSCTFDNNHVYQQHAAGSNNIVGNASLLGSATRSQATYCNSVDNNSSISAELTYVRMASSHIVGTVGVDAVNYIQRFAEVICIGAVEVIADPIIPIPLPAFGRLGGGCDITGDVTHWIGGSADFLGTGRLSPIGYENLMVPVADSRAFIRPQTIREFKRAYTPAFRRI